MELGLLSGLMGGSTKATTEMIKNTGRELTYGLMVENTLDNGKMINDMVKVNM
jgi:hypothetical protein